jgi:hypothetical protein
MRDFPLALAIAFERPWAYLAAVIAAVGMALLLVWSSGLLAYYPTTGWEVFAPPQELATIGALSLLFGLLVPLQVAALSKARSSAGTVGSFAGTIAGILSLSCCAPLLLPTLLSVLGLSGTALVSFNVRMRDFATPLALVSIALMAASIGLVCHTISTACKPVVRPDLAAAREE